MIDRYLIRYFLAVVDHGSFSRAAGSVNVSQPTLSVGIAKLERLLDRPLFRRSNRRVELTEAGARFVIHARRIEAEFAAAEHAVGSALAWRTFRLGVLTTIPSPWIEAILTRHAAMDANERIELVEGRERELIEGLARGRIDAALTIVRDGQDRYRQEALVNEGYAMALPAAHPLAQGALIAPEALADNVMIVRRQCELLGETSRHFTRHGVRPFFAARTTSDDRALALVRAGLGVTMMPDGFRAQGVARVRLAGFDFRRTIGLVHGPRVDTDFAGGSPVMDAVRAVVAGLG